MAKSKVRAALWRRHLRFVQPHEERFARDYRRVMREMREAVPRRTRAPEPLRRVWRKKVVDAMRPAYQGIILAGGRQFLTGTASIREKLAKGYLTKAKQRRASTLVVGLGAEFEERIAETVDTTFDALESILDEAVEDNLDSEEVEDLIEEEWSDVLGDRVEAIALTETNGAINSVRDYLMLELAELQDWVTAGDERVRVTHEVYGAAGARPVGFNWAHLVGGDYTLRYPCDPECDEAAEVVNCRCFTVPAGEVEMMPEDLARYLEDFDMEPEDVMLSSEQKEFDPDQPRDDQGRWTSDGGGETSSSRMVEYRDREGMSEKDAGVAASLKAEVKRQLEHEDMPATVARFIKERGLRVEYEPNPRTVILPDGQTAVEAGSLEFDPRYQDPPKLTLTSEMMQSAEGVVGHELGHLISNAYMWSQEAGNESTDVSELGGISRQQEGRLSMSSAYKSEGGVTDYAESLKDNLTRMVTGLNVGPSEQFAEVEGMFKLTSSRGLSSLKSRDERELTFAVALAKGRADRIGADAYPGFLFYGRSFPKTARAWLMLRGAKLSTLDAFDKKMSSKGVLKHLRGTEFEHDESTHGHGGGEGERKPTMTEVGRAIVGAPEGFNRNPADFEPLVFGKTQVGEKREAAVRREGEKLASGITMKGGDKDPDIPIKATREEIESRLEKLYDDALEQPEIIAHKDWYAEEAGKVVSDLHAEYAEKIEGLGKDQVAGILAASSANNVWDDDWRTPDAKEASNQVVTQNILNAWAENREIEVTADEIAIAAQYVEEKGGLEGGQYKGMEFPKPGTYTFRELAESDPRLGYLFNTSWQGASPNPKTGKLEKVERERGGPMGFGGMPGHVIPSLRLLRGDTPDEAYGKEGKVRSFYANITRALAGEKDDNVTLDIWMARAMFDHPGIKSAHFGSFAPTAARYEYLRSIVADLAKKRGLEPKQYQAAVWYSLRNGRNKWDDREDVKKWNADREAEKKAAKLIAQETKRRANRNSGQKKTKAYDIEAATEDEDLLFAWLQRFLAHERGEDVDGDPIFGPWDDLDEEAARSWRGVAKGVRVHGNVLTYVVKDFDPNQPRDEIGQWTSEGAAFSGAVVPGDEERRGVVESPLELKDEVRAEIAKKTAERIRASMPTQDEYERLLAREKELMEKKEGPKSDEIALLEKEQHEAEKLRDELYAKVQSADYEIQRKADMAGRAAAIAAVSEKHAELIAGFGESKARELQQKADETESFLKQKREEWSEIQKERNVLDNRAAFAADDASEKWAIREGLMKEGESSADAFNRIRESSRAGEFEQVGKDAWSAYTEAHRAELDDLSQRASDNLKEREAAETFLKEARSELRRADPLAILAGAKPEDMSESELQHAFSAAAKLDNETANATYGNVSQAVLKESETQEYLDLKRRFSEAQQDVDDHAKALIHVRQLDAQAIQKERDEFAASVGVGFYAKKALEDQRWYEANMNEMRGAWISVGGENPMRMRVAAGIGLGLEAGAIYDRHLGRFLKPDDYGDLRDDAKTMIWSGLIQREYLETQEDIANGMLDRIASREAPRDFEDWDEDDKYKMAEAKQKFFESDAASEAEFESVVLAWDNLSDDDKFDEIGLKGAMRSEAFAYAAMRGAVGDLETDYAATMGKKWDSLEALMASSESEQREYISGIVKDPGVRDMSLRDAWATLGEQELFKEDAWDAIKGANPKDVFESPPGSMKWASTIEDAAQESFHENFQWDPDDVNDAFNEWWNAKDESFKMQYATDSYMDAISAKEAAEEEADDEERPKSGPPSKTGYVTVYRGLARDHESYTPNFAESWSMSRRVAESFGGAKIMEDRVPVERILVFQGARNWRSAGRGAMGETEFEVIALSDLPKWYRESLREYQRAKRRAEEAAA